MSILGGEQFVMVAAEWYIVAHLCIVQLIRALEEDEFAVEHQLAYRLDQVISAMAVSNLVGSIPLT